MNIPNRPDARPISHLLHMPNDENVNIQVMPLSPESTQSLLELDGPERPKTFADRALERHRIFIEKEANAPSDSERLHIFTEYMVAESRIRRDRYEEVFKSEDLQPNELLVG
ncbi:MAG: hypothetical protein ACRYGG_02055, partial [Janthinobacterium lividum]